MALRGLLLNKSSPASCSLPSSKSVIASGTAVLIGQCCWQSGFLHFKQRFASDNNFSILWAPFKSKKSLYSHFKPLLYSLKIVKNKVGCNRLEST